MNDVDVDADADARVEQNTKIKFFGRTTFSHKKGEKSLARTFASVSHAFPTSPLIYDGGEQHRHYSFFLSLSMDGRRGY